MGHLLLTIAVLVFIAFGLIVILEGVFNSTSYKKPLIIIGVLIILLACCFGYFSIQEVNKQELTNKEFYEGVRHS